MLSRFGLRSAGALLCFVLFPPMLKRALVLIVAVLYLGPTAQAQSIELNLSTDLIRLGIASQNMLPDQRELDSGPLFNAALNYIRSRRVQRVTLSPGSFYFLTPRPDNGRYVYAQDLEDVTFDLNGAHLYFREPFRTAFSFFALNRVTFQRFTVDFLEYHSARCASLRSRHRTG